jgi:hypothetical protein
MGRVKYFRKRVKNQLFLTGCIRSGTNWIYEILSEYYNYSHSEYFEYQDLEKRKMDFSNKESLLFKINEDMRNLNLLQRYFPGAKIIIVIRNPLEVINSIYKPNEKSKPYRPFVDLREKWARGSEVDLLPAAIRRFESYYPDEAINIITSVNKNILVLKYEDLINKFKSEITSIFEFCKIKQNHNPDSELLPIRTPNQGISLKDFSLQNQEVILSSRIPFLCKSLNYSLG